MQDRYAGDIGDYVKLALLRTLSSGRALGVAWYLYPDEGHNGDGRHTRYLQQPEKWRALDPELFDALARVVDAGRSVKAIEASGLMSATYHGAPLTSGSLPWQRRSGWRAAWFESLQSAMQSADIVFADPDNGLVDDDPRRRGKSKFGKQIPVAEALALAHGRSAVIYHHNTRRAGGHDAEVDHWLQQLGPHTLAVRATSHSCRTFFVLNPDAEIQERASRFCNQWSKHGVRLHC
ncbi:hypothetical protein [Camelimonas lactis]|uniref:Uncharacterized protein n=1 Tax=Camelimonas lactis TaxID=659006 RepID=A0A4R2GTW4_9HYPH|nr:hypothetical protein [Camelimonas lactis]TCO12365.1 hypothetical protein EV666_10910 [Camelimonas lactis]